MLDVIEDVRNEFKVKLTDKFEEEVLLFFFFFFDSMNINSTNDFN